MPARHEGNPTSKERRLLKFNDTWRLIVSFYTMTGEKQEGIRISPDRKALAELKVAFMKISPPPPTLNLIENPRTDQERVLRVQGLDLGSLEIPIKGGRKRILTLGFLPNPTPLFQLFEEYPTQQGGKGLSPATNGTHREIFEAKPPSIQLSMLRRALWKICTL